MTRGFSFEEIILSKLNTKAMNNCSAKLRSSPVRTPASAKKLRMILLDEVEDEWRVEVKENFL